MPWLLDNLTNIGLTLDIIGALLIFFDSPKVDYQTIIYNRHEKKPLKKKANRKNRLAKSGALILFFGFALQLLDNLGFKL